MADQEQDYRALRPVIEPITTHDHPMLRQKVESLKQQDGESWAIGEILERACIYLDAKG